MLNLLSSIIQVISYGYVITQIKERKINIKKVKNILLMLIMIVLSYIIGITNTGFTKTIIIYCIFTISYKMIYDISIKESAIINSFSVGMHCMCELIVTLIIILLGIDINVLKDFVYLTPLSGLLVFLTIIIVMLFIKYKLIELNNTLNFQRENNKIFYMIIVVFASILFSMHISSWNERNMLSNIITVFIYGIILLFLILEKYKLGKKDKEFNELFKQSQNISSVLKKYQKRNHENQNDLSVIKDMSLDNPKLQKYIDELLNDKNISTEKRLIKEIYKINDPGINGFLTLKLNKMLDNKINLYLYISDRIKKFNFNKLNPKEYKNLCRILGIYLDNAYEASIESKEKEVTIEINVVNNKLEIVISNTYKGKIKLEKMDTYGYTTKGGIHGTGLSIVQEIISKNHFINQERKIIKNYYFQYLYVNI